MNTRFLIVVASAGFLAATAQALNETATDQATILAPTGQAVGTWELGWGFDATATAGPTGVTVSFPDGSTLTLPGTGPGSEVLLGNVAGSVPTPVLIPPMSVATLSAATLDAQAPDAAGLSLTPAGGTMTGSFRVTVNVFPPRTIKGPGQLVVSVDGGPPSIMAMDDWEALTRQDGGALTLTFIDNGPHSVVARITHAGVETVAQATWLLAAGDDATTRDTDLDGIGDQTELSLGLDPFVDDLRRDGDRDGWSDFDERLRGSSPLDAGEVPLDTDGDGWSDLDESWRGTNPNLASSKPVARSLYAVEYDLTSEFYAESTGAWPFQGLSIAFYASGSGRALGFVAGPQKGDVDLMSPEGLGLLSVVEPWGLIVEENGVLPNYVKGPTRVPGDEGIIVSIRVDGIGPELRRTWVSGTPDATPSAIAALAAAMPPSMSTDPLANYKEALAKYVVRAQTARVHPESALGVHFIAAAVAWAAGIDVGAPVTLSPSDGSACGEYRSRLGHRFEDLVRYSISPVAGAPSPMALLTGLWAPPDGDETTTTAEARRLQRALPGSDLAVLRYRIWLIAYAGLDAVLGYSAPSMQGTDTSPWSPAGDSDLDGLTNLAELESGLDLATDPLYPDSDDDGYGDLADPCPRDSENACLEYGALGQDTDGDGVIDALDNCWRSANVTQKDTNQDGIGDACEAAAQILQPATDLDVLPGTWVTLEALVSAEAAEPVSLRWHVQGAHKGSGPVFSLRLDESEWGASVVTVALYAGAGGGTEMEVDRRTFRIADLAGPVPCLAIDCSDGDPCTDDGCDLTTGCTHTPIPQCQPCSDLADCDDGNDCTAETCSGQGVCVREKLQGTPCSDGNACTGSDVCGAAGCVPGGAVDCDDDDPCTVESCDPASGCVYQPDPTPDLVLCPLCTEDADCGTGQCIGGACCDGNLALDVTLVWNPGDPAPTICLEAGTEITITATSTVSNRVKFLNPSGAQIFYANTTTSLNWEIESVAVSGAHSLTSNGTAPVTFTVHLSVDEIDDVPAFGEAFRTTVGTVGAEVTQRFVGTAGMRVSFVSGYGPGGCDDISLLDPSGVTLYSTYTCAASAFSDVRTLPTDGIYSIYVDNTTLTSNAVDTTVWVVPPDPVVMAIVGGGQASLPITAPGQNGTFEFVASAGDRVSLGYTTVGCTDFEWRAPSGAIVDSVYSCAGSGFREPKTLTETGIYRWTVNPTTSATGTARLTAYLVPPDLELVGVMGGAVTTLSMSVPGQNGTVIFDAVAGQRLSVTFSVSNVGCPTIRVLAPSGAEVVDYYTCATPYLDAKVLPETGTYRLTFDPSAGNAGSANVTLIDVPPDASAHSAIGAGPSSFTTTAPGQNAKLTFDAVGGESVILKGTHASNRQAAYRLRDPLGTVVHSKANVITSYTSPAIVLTTPGTYTLEQDMEGSWFGTTSLRVDLAP